MREETKKFIRVGAEVGMWTLITAGLFITYFAGLQNGKLEICDNQNMTLIDNRGIYECWDDFRLEEYKKQWNNQIGGESDGLQLNFTG